MQRWAGLIFAQRFSQASFLNSYCAFVRPFFVMPPPTKKRKTTEIEYENPEKEKEIQAHFQKFVFPTNRRVTRSLSTSASSSSPSSSPPSTSSSASSSPSPSPPSSSSSSSSSRKRKPSQKPKSSSPLSPPAKWEEVWNLIEEMRKDTVAPVDTLGAEALPDKSDSPINFRFQTLMALMLSSQTKDEVVSAAIKRLQSHPSGLSLQTIQKLTEEEVKELIYGVGFHNRKAGYIKKAAGILEEKHGGDIPRTLEGLCALPGVGPKMAHLVMQYAWDETVGIGVDVHVHRISDRLGWTKKASTPEMTRQQLEGWLPRERWRPVNGMLVGFGQTICRPVGPKCGECLARELCPVGKKAGKGGKGGKGKRGN